jgi:endonuclease/exonuclease/phosphatase family metal-dependent hydrolase
MPIETPLREIKVVSFNICHGKGTDGAVSLSRAAQVLKTIGADIAALQEVDKRMARSFFQDQAHFLAEYTGLDFFFAPNLHFSGLSSFGNALLCKYPILKKGNIHLPGTKEQRGLQHCVLVIPGMGQICFFNTHLGLSGEERAEQADSIAEAVAKAECPVLLAGDFNCPPTSPELRPLSDNLRYCSSQPLNTYPSIGPHNPIDQIYMSAEWEILDLSVYSSYASDHCPLVCTLRQRACNWV